MLISLSAFAQSSEYNESEAIKICGHLEKKQTRYDGIKGVFTHLNDAGERVRTYYVRAEKPQAKEVLQALQVNQPIQACITGVPYDGVMFDSPAPFYTFEITQK